MKTGWFAVALVATVCLARPAPAGDVVYLDLSGIDNIHNLYMSEAQKQALKQWIVADVQSNFDVCMGQGKVTITTDPTVPANRTVRVRDTFGWGTKPDGTSGPVYGRWNPGSAEVTVYLRNFYRTDRSYYQTDGQWDMWKLSNGIGRSIAHEIAHTYSVGHNAIRANKRSQDQNKMTRGGLVSKEDRANETWLFDDHTTQVVTGNLGKPPCQTAEDYQVACIGPVFFDAPAFANVLYDPNLPDDPNSNSPLNSLDEYDCFDARLQIAGPLAELVDLGWRGRDSDGGIEDGHPECDFIYKASAAEPSPPDLLTFFAEHHDSAQFILRGREGSPWEGVWFPMSEAIILPDDFVVTPAGDEIFRRVELLWDIDGDGLPDVDVSFDSFMVYEPYGAEFNGWQIRQAWPWPADLDHDFDTDLADLATLLSNYGQPYGASLEDGDQDGDRDVDLADLAALLAEYGSTYPGWALWSENFDTYAPGSGLHGQGGWKGWDNDPAFDAVVADDQALSLPQSVDIKEGADLVHEFSGASAGAWELATWQYIPADFVGGGGDLPGTFFIMLNTYSDGGPHEAPHWSVQLQFDSNDGMLKVYHGDGLNTIDVPYAVDRWVEIRVVIDLDTDWTEIYYDGGPIVGYSWTGGVLGGGGGASDIAAIDLYANGSTSVYYDDLVLRAMVP